MNDFSNAMEEMLTFCAIYSILYYLNDKKGIPFCLFLL